MRFNRSGAALSLLATSALVLSGCGGNTNTSSSQSQAASAKVDCGGKMKLKSSGATAQENAMEQFVYAYVHACPGYTLDYNANGSGAGVTDFVNNQTDLAGSGDPLNPSKGQPDRAAQRCGSPAWDLPTVFEPIAVTYHIGGVSSLKLDGPTTAKIFNGSITSWNDPAIKKLNPSASLPSTAIAVVHRSDGSGTTFNFATYLARVSPEWKNSVGADTAVEWPTGIGAKGNEGVAGNVSQLAGAIGYVEYAYAKQNHLTYARMMNHAGKAVEPDANTFRAAAANADWAGAANNDFYILFLDSPGPNAWPIAATTFVLVYKNPTDKAATAEALKFFKWSFEKGDQEALSLDYVPLPDNAVKAIETSWKGIQGSGM